jgi:hypothetical protein
VLVTPTRMARVPRTLAFVVQAMTESKTRTESGFSTGPKAAPTPAALGAEGNTVMNLLREPRTIAFSTTTFSCVPGAACLADRALFAGRCFRLRAALRVRRRPLRGEQQAVSGAR